MKHFHRLLHFPGSLVILWISLGAVQTSAFVAPASNRAIVNLDATWKFQKSNVSGAQATTFNDGSWSSISLPHTWNATDGATGDGVYYQGIGWYRKHFTVDPSYAGRSFYLRFDGANQVTTVYLNGTKLGQHIGGYAAFCFDATSAILVGGDNVLAVSVDNTISNDITPIKADFTFFGGIYRDVNLLITDKLAITPLDFASPGVYLMPSAVSASSASLQVTVKLKNDNTSSKSVTISTVITDATGTAVATLPGTATIAAGGTGSIVQNTTIANPHLWNGLADPYTYQATVEVMDGATVTDVVQQPLGFRFYKVDPNQGFSLNGTYLDLHGANRHQDRAVKGWAIGPAEHLEDFNLMKGMGCTALRLSHYQHAEYLYDLCDQNGMIVWAEIPYIDYTTSTAAFTSNTQLELKELIRQNYNHPSICFWSTGNEVQSSTASNTLMKSLNDLAHTEDPTRLTTFASSASDAAAINFNTDLVTFNKYFGWYTASTALTDFGPWADGFHKAYPTKAFGVSEFGAGAGITQHADPPARPDPYGSPHPEEYQNLYHETYWNAMKTRKFLWGKFVWAMFDFASDGRTEGDTKGLNDKGLVTRDRKTLKDSYFWYRANWTTAPMVYITSRRFTPRASGTVNVKVYSNTDSVKVYINDVLKGTLNSNGGFIFKWTGLTILKGANYIKAVGYKNGVQVSDLCEWTFGATDAIAPPLPTELESSFWMGADRIMTVNNPGGHGDLRISNLSGSSVYEKRDLGVGSSRIPLQFLSHGVYLVTLEGPGTGFSRKIAVP